jgi:dTDP-4-amino-4,6-dideoxygalactose transaminase
LSYFRKRFGYQPGDFPNAEQIGQSTLSLPLYPSMPVEHVDYVVEALRSLLGQRRMSA